MVLHISSIIGTTVTISLHVASIIDTIIAMILITSVASKADTIVAVGSGAVTGVTTAITDRNLAAVAIKFGKLLFRRHRCVTRTACCPPP